MHVAKDDVNVKIDKPGAILRQKKDFGSVSGYDKISAEYFTLSAKDLKGINARALIGDMS
jgi:hypothetical protein